MNNSLAIIIFSVLLTSFSSSISAQKAENMEYTQLSCAQLYVLATQLEPGTQRYRSPLFNEKTRVLAVAIGSISNVGYYYFGFTVARDYVEDYRVHTNRQELDKVRYYMAQQYCFQKS